jgi:hypothetical protein
MQDPFYINKGYYIPNPNRGKVSLLTGNGALYGNEMTRPADFYKNNDYYYQNFNNGLTYYLIDDLGNIVSEAQGLSRNYLCISNWQPLNYHMEDEDLINVIPISYPWICG